MSGRHLRIAIVGPRGIGRRHLAALRDAANADLVGVLASSFATATVAADEWGGTAYRDLESMLDGASPDAVIVCSPPHVHGPVEEMLVARGIPFLIEKPIDVDGSTARRIAAAAAERDLVTAVSYQFRALDTLDAVRTALAGREVGMVTGTWLTSVPPPTWWHRRATSGGQLVEQATHLVDLARHLIGEAQPVAATTSYVDPSVEWAPTLDVATSTSAMVRFETGAIGTFIATCLISGTHTASLELAAPGVLATITQQSVELFVDGERTTIETGADPFARQLQAFLAAVRTADPAVVLCSYADALATHELCLALEQQAAHTATSTAAGQPALTGVTGP